MSINLKQLFEIVGEVKNIKYSLDLSDYELFHSKPFYKPVEITGKIENKAGVVFLDFETEFELKLNCDRCLEEFTRVYKYSFEHILVNELHTDNDEYILLEDYNLDLDDLALADMLLNLPSKLLCKEDCKGLCMKCGQNFNKASCECEEKIIDPRLSVLGKLLEEMKDDE